MQTFNAPKTLTPSAIDQWTGPWIGFENAPDLEIKFPNKAFYTAGAIALVAACVRRRQEAGLVTRMDFPPGGDLEMYLERMDFFACLGLDRPISAGRRASQGRFVELKPISTVKEGDRLAHALVEFVETQVDDHPHSLSVKVEGALSELGANIVQHSGASGFGMGQGFQQQQRMEFAYADHGIGFHASLKKNPEWERAISSEGDAIQLALAEKVSSSTDSRKNAGWGLHDVEELCRRTSGKLRIMSGNALLELKFQSGKPQSNVIKTCPHYRGAWICLTIPLDL